MPRSFPFFAKTKSAPKTRRQGLPAARRRRLPLGVQSLEPRIALAVVGGALEPRAVTLLADTTPPVVRTVTAPATRTYGEGATIAFRVNFSEPVVASGSPTLPIAIGENVREAVWNGKGSGSRSLVFSTVVQAGDLAPSGVSIAGPITFASGAAISDKAGNGLLPAASGTFRGARVDAIGPRAIAFGPISVAGNRVSRRVTFTEPVVVTGKPALPFQLDGAPRQLVYARGSGTDTIIFEYRATVREVPALRNVVASSAVIDISRGRITDLAGTAVSSRAQPTDIMLSAASILESEPPGTVVGVLSAIDADGDRDRHMFSLVPGIGATHNASFFIDGTQLKAATSFNAQAAESLSVRVRATDSGALSVEKVLVIAVTDVNQAPTGVVIPVIAPRIAENTSTAARLKLGDIVIADDALGTNAITLTGPDASRFEVEGAALYLKAGIQLDFETKPSYAVTVNVADAGVSGSTPVRVDFTLTVTDVNDVAPVFTSVTTGSVAENAPTPTAIYTAITTDADGTVANRAVTYSIKPGAGDAALVAIDAMTGVVTLLASANFEAKASYAFTVVATDVGTGATLVTEQAVIATVTDVNEAPTAVVLVNTTPTIGENQSTASGVRVATIVISDDALGVNAILLTGIDAGSFEVRGAGLFLRPGVTLDFETKQSYAVTVNVVDSAISASTPMTVGYTLAVVDVNEPPTNVALSATIIAENAGADAVVGALSTADPDSGNTFTYALVAGTGDADNASFTVVGSQLRATSSFDFETKSSHTVRVRSTDQGGLSTEKQFTVAVRDVNEAPAAVALANAVPSLPENTSTTSRIKVADIVITDDALGTSEISLTGTDEGIFETDGFELFLRAGVSLDFETKQSYAVTASVADSAIAGGTPVVAGFTLDVTDINDGAPLFTSGVTGGIAENELPSAAIYTAATTDADGTTANRSITYTIEPGVGDAAIVQIDSMTGVVTLLASANYEAKPSYAFTVVATNVGTGATLVTQRAVTVAVADVNEVSTDITLSATTITENVGAGAVVGTLSTADPDSGNTFTYTLVSGTGDADNASFNVLGSQLRASSSFDFETKSVFLARVRSTDQGGLSFEKTFTITVTNANEAPTDIALSATSIAENAGGNAVVGTLSTADPDSGSTFTYTLVAGTGDTDNASFNISGNRLRAASSLDFETKSSHTVRVRSTDQSGLSTEKQFTITVTDLVVEMAFVTVGNAGNSYDSATSDAYGTVNYQYRIGTYEVTIGQYAAFLNAVAANDPYGLYDTSMNSRLSSAGISRSGAPGSYTYSVVAPAGVAPTGADSAADRPITFVSWFDAARFANWMHNGQGSGSTETGAYRILTGTIFLASRTNNVNTYELTEFVPLVVGDQVSVTGLGGSGFNVTGVVTSVSWSYNRFTIAYTGANATATGTGRMTSASPTAAAGAQYRLPTVNEWYKAAYYSPELNAGSGGYFLYATQSNSAPGNTIGGGANQANYKANVFSVTQSSSLESNQNYLTNVGAFTNSSSYYGTFDQSGNVSEWNEAIRWGEFRGYMGGNWIYNAASLTSSGGSAGNPQDGDSIRGFRLASAVADPGNRAPTTIGLSATSIDENSGANALVGMLSTVDPDAGDTFTYALVAGTGSADNGAFTISGNKLRAAASLDFETKNAYSIRVRAFDQGGLFTERTYTIAVTDLPVEMQFVTVGDAGAGNVAYDYRIGAYEVTNAEYATFLNAVAATDAYGLYGGDGNAVGGITRTGTSGSYAYAVKSSMGDKPVNFVNWFDAARFANWMHNGSPSGAQGPSTTERGAYTLDGQASGAAPPRSVGARFVIPNQDEWRKAAYYAPTLNAGAGGFYTYATQSDVAPTGVSADASGRGSAGSAGNFANYGQSADWNGRDGNVTTVGANGMSSYYGTFDQNGNVSELTEEWHDNSGTLVAYVLGGNWLFDVSYLSNDLAQETQSSGHTFVGFRLARPA